VNIYISARYTCLLFTRTRRNTRACSRGVPLTKILPFELKQRIIDEVWRDLEPKTYNEISKSISECSKSVVANYIEKLAEEPNPKIQVKKYDFAYIVTPNWKLPSLALREDLDLSIIEGQYPIVNLIAKMRNSCTLGSIQEIKGKMDLTNNVRSLIEGAEKTINWWAGDFSSVHGDIPLFEKALRRQVKIQIIMNISFHSFKNAERILQLKECLPKKDKEYLQIRHWESGWRGTIVDGRVVSLVVKKHKTEPNYYSSGDPDSDATHYYEGYVVKDQQWLNYINGWWSYFWQKAGGSPEPANLIATIKEITHD
jgi:hypothetical protein